MIHKGIIVLLSLAALATLAGGIASIWVPVGWNSRQHPRFPRPILSIGYEVHGRPHVYYIRDAPFGGPNRSEKFWFVAHIWINTGKYNCGIRFYDVHCPLLMLVGLLGSYPVAFIIFRGPLRRWRRRRRGLCTACGYNLTGNTTGVCSECGEAAVGLPESRRAG